MLLLGFRDGVTLAGGLLLAVPERFAGAALLYGALPVDAGVALPRGALRGMPVFLAHGADDIRTPAPLLVGHLGLLRRESGALVWAERAPGGAQLAGQVVGQPGSRDAAEVELVAGIAAAAHRYATG